MFTVEMFISALFLLMNIWCEVGKGISGLMPFYLFLLKRIKCQSNSSI